MKQRRHREEVVVPSRSPSPVKDDTSTLEATTGLMMDRVSALLDALDLRGDTLRSLTRRKNNVLDQIARTQCEIRRRVQDLDAEKQRLLVLRKGDISCPPPARRVAQLQCPVPSCNVTLTSDNAVSHIRRHGMSSIPDKFFTDAIPLKID